MKWNVELMVILNVLLAYLEETTSRHTTTTTGVSDRLIDAKYLIEKYYPVLVLQELRQKRVYQKYSSNYKKMHIGTNTHRDAVKSKRRNQLSFKDTIQPSLPSVYSQFINTKQKRPVFDIGLAVRVCPVTNQVERIYSAKDITNTVVEVYQPSDNSGQYQSFFTVKCDYATLQSENIACPNCCRAIEERPSRCIQQRSFVPALIRRPGSNIYVIGHIEVNTGCSCAIS